MTDQRFWDLTRQISEPPSDPFELRTHLLDQHAQDPEVVPANEQMAGLQALHGRLHQAGANHSHLGLENGSGVQPFVDGGVKSSAYAGDAWRCKRCGGLFDRAEFVNMPIAAAEGRLSCRSCLSDARVR